MKVVTNFRNSEAYDEYVLREYLCYKIYNAISPVSFRVRLLKMKYDEFTRLARRDIEAVSTADTFGHEP